MVTRIRPLFGSLFALLVTLGAAAAQTSPPYYINREYRFAVIFPNAPMARDIAYTRRSGMSVPARQFYTDDGGERLTVTIIAFTDGPAVDDQAVDHAADQLRQKGEVRFQFADEYDPGLPGRQLNIFQSDGRQLRASVYMWDHRLYITEATAPPGSQAALQFEQSVMLLDADGNELNLDAAAFGQGP